MNFNISDSSKCTNVIPISTAFYNLMNEAAQKEDYELASMCRDSYINLTKDCHPVTLEKLDEE